LVSAKVILRKDKKNKFGAMPCILQLSDGNAKGNCPVAMKKYSLGFTVHPRDWNEKSSRVSKSNPMFEEYNNIIENAEEKASQIISCGKLARNDHIWNFMGLWEWTQEEISNSLKGRLYLEANRTKPHPLDKETLTKVDTISISKEGEKKFLMVWGKYQEHQTTEREFNTARRLPNVLKVVSKFCKKYEIPLTFSNMNEDFIYKFKNYLLNEHHNYQTGKKGVSNSTVHDFRKTLSAFLKFATKKKYNTYSEYLKWTEVTKKPKTDLQFLNEDQLVELKDFALRPGSSYDITRDLFLFSAYSGLRYIDMKQWIPTNVRNGVIKLRAEKSRKDCIIPLNFVTEEILAKYNGLLPKQANTKVNENIKEILKLMDYDKILVNRTISHGVKDIVTVLPLSKAITIHSARRSAINLFLTKGLSIGEIREITGNSIRSLEVYLKTQEEEIKKAMNKIDFKKSVLKIA